MRKYLGNCDLISLGFSNTEGKKHPRRVYKVWLGKSKSVVGKVQFYLFVCQEAISFLGQVGMVGGSWTQGLSMELCSVELSAEAAGPRSKCLGGV